MEATSELWFAPFRLELRGEQLWREDQPIPLRPKTFAVLRHLVTHPGQLVTQAELLDTVWTGTVVSDTVLRSCIRELRTALGDDVQRPRYIATVHRRGYRFIAPLGPTPPVASSQHPVASILPSPAPNTQPLAPSFVGRETELSQLHYWLEKALRGERQIIFVSGEAGIGKTTLVDAFLADVGAALCGRPTPGQPQRVAPTQDPWIAQGQCIEQFGAGEPYLPLLSALGQLGREPGHERLVEILAQHAPTWLVQMPALVPASEFDLLLRKTAGATRERMLRELAEALEVLTLKQPFLLMLEDLHWSDPSTLEFLSFLARRRQAAQLLVLGTYRPVDVLANGHPLRAVTQELQLHQYCQEMPVPLLSESDIASYLTARLPERAHGHVFLHKLAHAIHQRTEGNPLFMVNVTEEWLARGEATSEAIEVSTPMTIRQMIERQFDHLPSAEQQMLAIASVAGMEFSAATVAASLAAEVSAVEARCAELARRGQFLRASGVSEWPDGTVATRYRFLHALYQEVLHERVPAGRRIYLHQRIGECVETAYGEQTREIATELALHFEQGHDYHKAVQYLQQAGENAVRRSANQEAITHLTKGVELLKTLPDTLERARQELRLQYALGSALVITKEAAAPELEQVYTRTQVLCHQVGEPPYLFWVQLRLWTRAFHQTESGARREHAEQLLAFPQTGRDLLSRLPPTLTQGVTLFFLGELGPAREQLEEGIALYVPQEHRLAFYGLACLAHAAQVLWYLGYPEQARKRSNEALALAQEVVHPYSRAFALHWAASLHCLRGEVHAAHAHAEMLLARATERGLSLWAAMGASWRGWALAEQRKGEEGIAQIRQGVATRRTLGAELWWTYYLALLANACGKAGRVEEGLSLLTEALMTVNKTGERFYEAELYRLKGELLLQSKVESEKKKGKKQKAKACSEPSRRSKKRKISTPNP